MIASLGAGLALLVLARVAPEPTRLLPRASRIAEPAARHGAGSQELAIWGASARGLAADPLTWLALGAPLAAWLWLRRCPADRSRVALALTVLALGEVTAHGALLLKTAPAARFLTPDALDQDVARWLPEGGPWRIRARDAVYDDLRATRAGIEKTNVHDAFQLQHAAELYQALYPIFDPPGRATVVPEEVRRAVLDRMGVALLINDRPDPSAPWPLVATGRAADGLYVLYRNPNALPRAYVVPRVQVFRAAQRSRASLATANPRDQVQLDRDPLAGLPEAPRQSFRPADYQADDPDRVVIHVRNEAPGLLVVADTWMPGWSARLDGREVPLLRGDQAHRVIALPEAGPHRVVMTYQPPGAALGLAITWTTGGLWTAAALAALLASRPGWAARSGRVWTAFPPALIPRRPQPIA